MNLSSGGGNYATLFTDFDNDGDTDVFISKCSGPPCQLFRYDGGNTYTNVSTLAGIDVTPIQTWSSGIADFDNDGDMDIIITANSGTHKYFRNNFDTTNTLSAFTNITAGSGWDTNTSTNIDNIAYDFDNNGFIDVLGGGNKIMFNQGNSTFAPVSYSGITVGAVGDLNNDGFLDIQSGSTIRYAVPNGNNWLKVALIGIQSNSNGIGARVEIYGAWGKQIREIRSGQGFSHMSTMNAHFGIGTASGIDKVIVRWPSGVVDEILNVSSNQSLTVVEGAFPLSTASTSQSKLRLAPNPAKETLFVQTVQAGIELTTYQIFDMSGRNISNGNLVNQAIQVSNLANGTYFIQLTDKKGNQYTEKFIKN
jgi:hypothetical protein